LSNLLGASGYAAETFTQAFLPSTTFWSRALFSGLLEAHQVSAEPGVCWGMAWGRAVRTRRLQGSLILMVSSVVTQ